MKKILILPILICALTLAACSNGGGGLPDPNGNSTPNLGAQPTQLVMTPLEYDDTTKIVSWQKVTNASGYALRVGWSQKSASRIISNNNKMTYKITEPQSGSYAIYVKAWGNGTTYSDSAEFGIMANYTLPTEPPQTEPPLVEPPTIEPPADETCLITVEGGTGGGEYIIGSTVTIKPTIGGFLYFSNVTENSVLAFRRDFSLLNGYSFTATKDLHIRAVGYDYVIGLAVVFSEDMYEHSRIDGEALGDLTYGLILNQNVHYFYENTDTQQVIMQGGFYSPTYMDGYSITYKIQVPMTYNYIDEYLIVYVPELDKYLVFHLMKTTSWLGQRGMSVQNAQNNRSFRIEFRTGIDP